jgi:hypothetical protein
MSGIGRHFSSMFEASFAPQSARIAHIRGDSRSVVLWEKSNVRAMVVKGMGRSVLRIIPLPVIPLTLFRPLHFDRMEGRVSCRAGCKDAAPGGAATCTRTSSLRSVF